MDSHTSVSGSLSQWVSIQGVLLFLVVFLLLTDYVKTRRPSRFPPGPTIYPFVGNMFSIDFKKAHENITQLSEKYGDVYSLRMGGRWTVVLNGFKTIKEALVTQADSVSDRPESALTHDVSNNLGVVGTNGHPLLMRRLPGPHQTMLKIWNEVKDFLRSEVTEHRKDWDPSEPRDYIDCYLTEIKKSKGDAAAKFDEENLIMCCLDLFVAGSETTSSTLRWSLLFMTKYPEIQEKVQAELDHVIGRSRPPTMADRANLPYTEAVLHEIQRMGNIVPLSLPHVTIKDIQLGDYLVPKDTSIIPNLTSVMFDKNEWDTPLTFNPGHFLDKNSQFVKRSAFIPFSAGKRACLGENLAKMELFMFFTSFMQKFVFSMPPGVEPVLDYRMGITLAPVNYEICATLRDV